MRIWLGVAKSINDIARYLDIAKYVFLKFSEVYMGRSRRRGIPIVFDAYVYIYPYCNSNPYTIYRYVSKLFDGWSVSIDEDLIAFNKSLEVRDSEDIALIDSLPILRNPNILDMYRLGIAFEKRFDCKSLNYPFIALTFTRRWNKKIYDTELWIGGKHIYRVVASSLPQEYIPQSILTAVVKSNVATE